MDDPQPPAGLEQGAGTEPEPEPEPEQVTVGAVGDPGDLSELERLEAKLAAVESAMESLVAIAGASELGDAAVAQIRAVVNDDRFPPRSDEPGPGADG